MFHAIEGTHTTAVVKARRHHGHPTRVRTDQGALERAASGRDLRGLALTAALMAVALVMTAAPVCVILGEKGVAVSPSLWNVAVDLCRIITGLFGLLAVISSVRGRGSDSSRHDTLGSIASGAVLVVAAVAGLGLVIVITGLTGVVLLYVSGVAVADAFRPRHREPARPEPAQHV